MARFPALALWLLALAGAAAAQSAPRRVVVGSKTFAESYLLGEMFTLLLEAHTDLEVEHRSGLGGTLVCHEALLAGELHVYPEYTGTAWSVVLGERGKITDPLRAFLHVQARYRDELDLHWLAPLGLNNTYAIAMRRERAEALGVRTLSELAAKGGALRGGFSSEFMNRPDGYPGLVEAYGLALAEARGMEHALAYEALVQGQTDVVDAYSTDGTLLGHDLLVLADDRGFFPPYNAAPVVEGELLRAEPQVRRALERLAFRLPDERMIALNHAVEVEHRPIRDVAREFLEAEGLLEAELGTAARDGGPQGFLAFFLARRAETLRLLGEHLLLTGASVLLAALVAVPLGIVAARRRLVAQVGLGTAGVLQTIPGLALLAFLIAVPGLGLTARSAVVALTLYALLPILRNTYTGLREVDPTLVDAARGLGLTERQILWRIQLPLATRTILAGIRTATVITIGFATLAAFIGAGGLGEPIVTGLSLRDLRLILAGALPAALLAVVADQVLGVVERVVTPRGLRVAARLGAER